MAQATIATSFDDELDPTGNYQEEDEEEEGNEKPKDKDYPHKNEAALLCDCFRIYSRNQMTKHHDVESI